jgi:hypothetical protein
MKTNCITISPPVNTNLTPAAIIIGDLLIWFQNNCPCIFPSVDYISLKTGYSPRHIRRVINGELVPMGFVQVIVRRYQRTSNLFKVSELFFLPEIRAKFKHIFKSLGVLGMNVLFNNVRLSNSKFREYIKNLGILGLGILGINAKKEETLNGQEEKNLVSYLGDLDNPEFLKKKASEMQNEIKAAEILQAITPTIESIGRRFNLTLAGKIFITQFPEQILQQAVKATHGKVGSFGYFITVCKNSCQVQGIEANWHLKNSLMLKAGLDKNAPHTEPRNTQNPVFSDKTQNPEREFNNPFAEEPTKPKPNPSFQTNKPDYLNNRQYHADGTFTGANWKEQDIKLIPVDDILFPGKISTYHIQQLANEMKNWQKILDSYLKEAKTTITEPNLAAFVDTDSKILMAKTQIKLLSAEFMKRPAAEQEQAI